MKKILITGFEPFDNDSSNPSGEWVKWMLEEESELVQQGVLRGVILPVCFEESFLKLQSYLSDQAPFNPDIIMMCGLAKNRKALSVERIGINWIDYRIPDNKGNQKRHSKINDSGPDGLFSTIDLKKMSELDPEMVISTSAGEFVCNELLYRCLLHYKGESKEISFFHLPGPQGLKADHLIFERLRNILRGLL